MRRSLRPRTSKIDYSTLINSDDEVLQTEEDGEEFSPDVAGSSDVHEHASASDSPVNDNEDDDEDLGEEAIISKGEGSSQTKLPQKRHHSAEKGNAPSRRRRTEGGLHDQRSRTAPLFLRRAQVERLLEAPEPFKPSRIGAANSWNSDEAIADKFSRAVALNIGRGPVWELLEDRSWWKESVNVLNDEVETEALRRPRVHQTVRVSPNLQVLHRLEAEPFIPQWSPDAPTFTCTFGQPSNEKELKFKIFDSVSMDECSADSRSHVFWAGSSVWALDWCPIFAEDQPLRKYKQYLAVCPLPSNSYSPMIGVKCPAPRPACIQIWSFASNEDAADAEGKNVDESDRGHVACEIVLCIEDGPCLDLKWCPLPSNDPWENDSQKCRSKLGLLAGIFEDGSISIFVVPDPDSFSQATSTEPIFARIKPCIKLQLEEACFCCLAWGNSTRIAAGCSNGSVLVYDLSESLYCDGRIIDPIIFPTHYLPIHQSAVRAVCWINAPTTSLLGTLDYSTGPHIIASAGYDGCEILTDLREGSSNLLNRTRDVVMSVTYSHFNEGLIAIDQDTAIKHFVLDTSMFCTGRTMMEASGPIWDLSTSDYHPHLAVACADGCLYTTNTLKNIRRGPGVPRLFYKIYEMDFSRKTGEYKMMDQFLPQETIDRRNMNIKSKKTGVDPVSGIGAWSPEISVTRVRWNNGCGLARAPLLASATASGLCRIDWLTGRFTNKAVPFGGVELIRRS